MLVFMYIVCACSFCMDTCANVHVHVHVYPLAQVSVVHFRLLTWWKFVSTSVRVVSQMRPHNDCYVYICLCYN